MKLEDISIELPPKVADSEMFDIEQWRKKNPIDYFKMIALLLSADSVATMNAMMAAIYQVCRLCVPDVLYKYYSLSDNADLNDIKLNILKDCKIFMANVKDFNDPFDGKAFFYDNKELSCFDQLTDHDGRFIDDFTIFSKSASLTSNGINSMPMWAHYGSNHAGFCISYDMKDKRNMALSSTTFPIQYIDERVDITSYIKSYVEALLNTVKKQQSEGKTAIEINDISIIYISIILANLKHHTWSYENEFRCTVGNNGISTQYVDAYPKEIYIGTKCSDEHSKKLKRIGEELDIPVYKMVFDEYSENYALTPVKY